MRHKTLQEKHPIWLELWHLKLEGPPPTESLLIYEPFSPFATRSIVVRRLNYIIIDTLLFLPAPTLIKPSKECFHFLLF